MKQKDLALIIVVVVFSGVISLVIGRFVFAPPESRQQQVEVIDPITTDFPQPDSKYFNNASIDPTQLIRIGENKNLTPFDGSN